MGVTVGFPNPNPNANANGVWGDNNNIVDVFFGEGHNKKIILCPHPKKIHPLCRIML